MPRVYVGTFLTGGEAARVSQYSLALAQSINQSDAVAKATPLQKLHITWQFLGDLEEVKVQAVKELLQSLAPDIRKMAAPELVIEYSKLTLWPQGEAARVVVVTPDIVHKELSQTAKLIREALLPYLNVDNTVERNYKFMPHLTIMRFKEPFNSDCQSMTKSFEAIAPVIQRVDSINLIESHVGNNHTYESLLSITL